MKRLLIISLLSAVLLSACKKSTYQGNTADHSGGFAETPVVTLTPNVSGVSFSAEKTEPASESEPYAFIYKGTALVAGGLADDFIALFEPTEIFEAPSCAFEGMDRILYYNGFNINTYPINGTDYILSIVFTDDSVQTSEGIWLGSSREDVLVAYGTPDLDAGNSIKYTRGGMSLNFVIENDTVTDVMYYYDKSSE